MIHVGASCRHEARSGGVERRVSGAAKELRMVRGQMFLLKELHMVLLNLVLLDIKKVMILLIKLVL